MSAGEIAGILAGAGAVACAVAAARSARVAEMASQPWVSGRVTSATAQLVTVTVQNDGAGTAIDIRCRVAGGGWSPSIGSLAPGATQPRNVIAPAGFAQTAENVFALKVDVEFSGLSGARWRLTRMTAGAPPSLRRFRNR